MKVTVYSHIPGHKADLYLYIYLYSTRQLTATIFKWHSKTQNNHLKLFHFVQKKKSQPLCQTVLGECGTRRSISWEPAPITSLSALLSFDSIHTRKRGSGGGSKREGGTYASLSLGTAGNILTSSRKKPLNIAEKNRLREGASVSCTLFMKTEAKFYSSAPLTKGLIMKWP